MADDNGIPFARTIQEHVQSLHERERLGGECEGNYTSLRSARYQIQTTPPRPPNAKDLDLLVAKVYRDGSRSPQLMGLINQGRTSGIPMRVARLSAEYISYNWEARTEEHSAMTAVLQQRITNLTNYIASCLCTICPSATTLILATYYIGRLRRLYPAARGEAGCGHRLFTIAMLISTRYHELSGRPVGDAFYQNWSRSVNGVFSAEDLMRMEAEFISFLRFKLYVSYADFEYFFDRVYDSECGQVVPGSAEDMLKAIYTKSCDGQQEDAAVPNLEEQIA